MIALLFYLIVAHCLADYPLQGDFLARAKNQTAPLPGVPWQIALFAHAMIHAGFVAALTGSLLIGSAELVAHMAIDYAKSDGWLGKAWPGSWQEPEANSRAFWHDQALHIACKVAWATVIFLA